MRRGEIRWYTFGAPDKRRPVVILTRTSALAYLAGVTVAPLTTTIRDVPTEVLLTPEEDGVDELCVANLHNLQTIPKEQLGSLMTTLRRARLREIDRAVCFALGMDYLAQSTP